MKRVDLLTILSSTLLSLSISAFSAMSLYADKFSANLIVKLVPLSSSTSSAMFDGKFLVDWVGVVLSIKVSGLANLLKP